MAKGTQIQCRVGREDAEDIESRLQLIPQPFSNILAGGCSRYIRILDLAGRWASK
jgi:hypothetical protein